MFGFTKSWFESFWRYRVMGVKRIKLAVVGSPSSGKSYLLYDIVQTLGTMGKRQTLPLTFPYSGFAKYITDIYSPDGCVAGTKIYACRQENHYGAMIYELTNDDKKLDIEFLNIPGEVFSNEKQIALFFSLKSALERTSSGIFTVTEWRSLGGEVKLVVEPTDSVRASLGLPAVNKAANVTINEESHKILYGNWDIIYSQLNQMQFKEHPETRKNVNGKYLMKHFYELVSDSLMQSIKDTWQTFALGTMEVTRDEFINTGLDRNFYFCKYCQDATDMVICDKLYSPGQNTSPEERRASENFPLMLKLINNFLIECKKKPNVYLAFRGADMIMKEYVVKDMYQKIGAYHGMRDNIIYSCFMHSLLKEIRPNYQYPAIERWIGMRTAEEVESLPSSDFIDARDKYTLTNQTLRDHIEGRMGNEGSGFWELLKTVGSRNKVRAAIAQDLPIAPHVYFTSTPIDTNYNIYEGDQEFDNTRFIRNDGRRWVVFNTVTPLCFGTFQLCMDILVQNGISPATFKTGELIRRLQRKLK